MTSHPLTVSKESLHIRQERGYAEPFREALHPFYPNPIGRHLSQEIPGPFLRSPDIGQKQPPHVFIPSASYHEFHGRDDDTFLIDFLRQRHRPSRYPADIGMVRPIGHKPQQRLSGVPLHKNWRHDGQIRQMRPPAIRIIHHGHIAR